MKSTQVPILYIRTFEQIGEQCMHAYALLGSNIYRYFSMIDEDL